MIMASRKEVRQDETIKAGKESKQLSSGQSYPSWSCAIVLAKDNNGNDSKDFWYHSWDLWNDKSTRVFYQGQVSLELESTYVWMDS